MLLKHFMFTVRNDGDLKIVGTIIAVLALHLYIHNFALKMSKDTKTSSVKNSLPCKNFQRNFKNTYVEFILYPF